MSQTILLRYDPRLIEEAVFLALRNHPDGRQYQEDRERVYEIADARERDRVFDELNKEWLVRLGLNKAVEQSLAEQPEISSRSSSCFVGRVAQTKEEGAELFVAPDEQLDATGCRIVSILLRPESMLQPETLLTFSTPRTVSCRRHARSGICLRAGIAKGGGRSDLRHVDYQSLSRAMGRGHQRPDDAPRLAPGKRARAAAG